jgi:hypothetical protein
MDTPSFRRWKRVAGLSLLALLGASVSFGQSVICPDCGLKPNDSLFDGFATVEFSGPGRNESSANIASMVLYGAVIFGEQTLSFERAGPHYRDVLSSSRGVPFSAALEWRVERSMVLLANGGQSGNGQFDHTFIGVGMRFNPAPSFQAGLLPML